MKVTRPGFYCKWIQRCVRSMRSRALCGTTALPSALTAWHCVVEAPPESAKGPCETRGRWRWKAVISWVSPGASMRMYYQHSFKQACLTAHLVSWLYHTNKPALRLRNRRSRPGRSIQGRGVSPSEQSWSLLHPAWHSFSWSPERSRCILSSWLLRVSRRNCICKETMNIYRVWHK